MSEKILQLSTKKACNSQPKNLQPSTKIEKNLKQSTKKASNRQPKKTCNRQPRTARKAAVRHQVTNTATPPVPQNCK